MDWIPEEDESSAGISEGSGDSDADAIAMAPSETMAYDSDDAESCCGGGGDDDDEGGAAFGKGEVEERCLSWRCWLVERAPEYPVGEVDDRRAAKGCSASVTSGEPPAAASDAESSRLFWEACLAHGYP
ncbi:hypothetical protein B296_00040608 [Ensete ventricosum]|uniref:Uncharacterized protein n=1 Tax=Ensete ventricosum TaxID=4639 RepID=A0A426Y4H2_ENSVE|nr:hypothetical protein B296_00040608 [Ensete ventricosum]